MAVSTPAKQRGFARPLVAVLLVIVIVAVLGYGYATPYLTLNHLKRAADARDAQTVSEYVDYPALRESLKEQIGGLITHRIEARASGNPLAALGAMIGVALIGPLVDAYATPDGVAALLNGMPPRGDLRQRPPAAPQNADNTATASAANPAPVPASTGSSANGAPPQPPQTTAGYRSLNEFAVTYQHGVGDARYAAILRREGLFTWKLAAVDLNSD